MQTQSHTSPSAAITAITKFNFRGDELDVIPLGTQVYVAIRRVCEALGVSYPAQLTKLKSDPSATMAMIATVAEDGKTRDIACTELRSLPLWLATIHPSKVKPAVREKLIAYRRECADVLADHFLGKRGAAHTEPAAPALTPEAVAQIVALAIGTTLATIMDRIAAMERGQTGGVVGPAIARMICASLQETAKILFQCKQGKSAASLRTRIENRLRGSVSWAGTGRSWERLPLAQHGNVLAELSVLRETAEGIRLGMGLGKQLPLRLVHAPSA